MARLSKPSKRKMRLPLIVRFIFCNYLFVWWCDMLPISLLYPNKVSTYSSIIHPGWWPLIVLIPVDSRCVRFGNKRKRKAEREAIVAAPQAVSSIWKESSLHVSLLFLSWILVILGIFSLSLSLFCLGTDAELSVSLQYCDGLAYDLVDCVDGHLPLLNHVPAANPQPRSNHHRHSSAILCLWSELLATFLFHTSFSSCVLREPIKNRFVTRAPDLTALSLCIQKLKTKEDLSKFFVDLLDPLTAHTSPRGARIHLGHTATHYDAWRFLASHPGGWHRCWVVVTKTMGRGGGWKASSTAQTLSRSFWVQCRIKSVMLCDRICYSN